MYSEYKVIKGVLCHRGNPHGDWRVCSNAECVMYYEDLLTRYEEKIEELDSYVDSLEDNIDW
jgi:hypothetical protein